MNRFVNYLLNIEKMKLIKNKIMKYFLNIGNKVLKSIRGHLSVIGNPKLLKFINPIFDTG